jgi:thymidylate kinase
LPAKVDGWVAVVYALRAVTIAWDRRQLLVKARRQAANGELVICDRYPSEIVGSPDSPRLQPVLAQEGIRHRIYNWLAHLEHQLYQQISPPDIVLRLTVSVETAKRRNQERIKLNKETDSYVEFRHHQNKNWCRSGTKYIYDIDTEQPFAETILNVKKAIWESL